MHFRVVLQNRPGTQGTGGSRGVDLADGLAERVIASEPPTALLKYLDPYGDLVLNHIQMPDLLNDLDAVEAGVVLTDGDRAVLAAVRTLATECADGAHLYLTFVGD